MARSKTRKNKKSAIGNKEHLIVYFLEMLNTIKLFHWKTTNYAIHKATDDLHGQLSGNVDTFVEIMMGKNGSRANLTHTHIIELHDYSSPEPFKTEIARFKQFLIGLTNILSSTTDSDLLNIRDEMLGHLNQFSYLLTLH